MEMGDFEANKASANAELQEFLMLEKQKAQVNAQVMNEYKIISIISHNLNVYFTIGEQLWHSFLFQIHEFNEICWDKCIDTPSNKLDSKSETCLTNCVDRFIDTSLLVTNRFAQLIQKGGG